MSNEPEGEDADTDVETPDEEEVFADESVEEEENGGFQYGDFVRVGYTARTVEGGQLVDTTDPEVAEEEGVADQGEFEPRIIVLGEGHIFEAVEEAIVGGEPGDGGSVVVPAEDAFGEYDDEQVRTISADRIPEDDRRPGANVTIDGEQGLVETIIGGRARVDFNHPLAGEAVEYEYEVLDEVEDRNERAQGLLGVFLDMQLETWFETDVEENEQLVEPDEDEARDEEESDAATAEADAGDEADEEEVPEPEFETVEVEKETLYIEATPQLSMNQQWMFQKQQIAQQLVDMLGVDRVIVQETLGEGAGMMGGMGGMMGGMGGMGEGDIEEALEDEDIDADEIVEELEGIEE